MISKDISFPIRVGYVVKRYPRFSETFIVNEILANEESGLDMVIFSLLPTSDTHFQDIIGRVKTPVVYIKSENIKGIDFWEAIEKCRKFIPSISNKLEKIKEEDYKDVYQSLVLSNLLYENKINHIHAHFATAATTVTRLASLLSGIPYTFTAHARDIYHNDVIHSELEKKIHDATKVITIGEYNLNHLNNMYPQYKDKINLVYNGLDLTRLPFFNNVQKNKNEIISVGRLIEKKGFNVLIDACHILNSRKISFNCKIIGTGYLEEKLKSQIIELKLKENVQLLGALPRSEMFESIQQAHVFVAPSILGSDGDRDGLPTTLLEAMAMGTPCIATNVTGIPEAIDDGITGILIPQNDPALLANALEKLFADNKISKSISDKGKELVKNKFDIKKNSLQLRKIFFNILVEKNSKNSTSK